MIPPDEVIFFRGAGIPPTRNLAPEIVRIIIMWIMITTIPIGSMVLLYMVTWIPSIYPSHVSIYTIHGSYGIYNHTIDTIIMWYLIMDYNVCDNRF
jgi:phage shock protein PspC (stress-responsive transcriptional regulator)